MREVIAVGGQVLVVREASARQGGCHISTTEGRTRLCGRVGNERMVAAGVFEADIFDDARL